MTTDDLAAPSVDDCLRSLGLKGMATATGLAAAFDGVAHDTIARHLASLVDAGLASPVAGERLRITDAGRARLDASFVAEAERVAPTMAQALDDFHAVNLVFKLTVTRWQLRDIDGEQVPNDHNDPAYDESVIRELHNVHDATAPILKLVSGHVTRLGGYRQRLDAALRHIGAGDHRYVAHPGVESYHTVWFELHEELIRLAGRTRSAEAEAGRA